MNNNDKILFSGFKIHHGEIVNKSKGNEIKKVCTGVLHLHTL